MGFRVKLRGNNLKLPMSALGQKQTSGQVRVMSALPPKADIVSACGMSVPCQKQTKCTAAKQLQSIRIALSRSPAPDAAVERPAVTAVLVGRLLVAALLAFAGATVALLAAAVPARRGLATGLLGTAAAAALFLLVTAVARRGGEA